MKRIILLIETSRNFGRQLITGIARYSRLHGPWSFYKEPIDLKSSVPKLTNWKPDGIIMRDSLVTEELLKLKIPTILAIHNSKYPQDLPVIKTDSEDIAKMAFKHFIEKGFRNFAYCGFDAYDWSGERGNYFRKYIESEGFVTHLYEQPQRKRRIDWEKEQRHVSEWIKKLPKPIALFACNDDRGQHILEVCKMNDIKVPEEVAVVGVDNDLVICETGDPPLSSIAMNVESSGYEAAALMDKMISDKSVKGKQIKVSASHIIQRQSSDVLAVNDPQVSKAISYIRQNAKNKILVEDVVKITSLSRRTLEKRFKESIRRTIYGEIRRVRIELISKMLMETDLPISEIAASFNFTDMEHISRYFKIEKGIGLREFRKQHYYKA